MMFLNLKQYIPNRLHSGQGNLLKRMADQQLMIAMMQKLMLIDKG
jgi:hypothetical protein